MRIVDVRNVRPGMVTARPVYGNQGQMLLNAKVKIEKSYIHSLLRNGITYLYIYDANLEDIQVEEVLRDDTRVEAYSLARDMMDRAKTGESNRRALYLKEKKIFNMVNKIIDELLVKKDVLLDVSTIKSADSYTFTHCVDVCTLATLTAVKLKIPTRKIKELALGALLHDLGKTKVPLSILNKPGALTDEEFDKIKKHPWYGYEMFKSTSYFSTNASMVIYQHHERYNGKGYPQNLPAKDTNQLAKITAIADVYDALVSDRVYRKGFHPSKAVEMLVSVDGVEFDPGILKVFLSFVSAYYIGTHVKLSTGESGIVIGNTRGHPQRPKVRVLYTGEDYSPHPNPYDVNLAEKTDMHITGII